MILHPAIGTNRWCGPSVVAILTGVDTDTAARELRRHWPPWRVKGKLVEKRLIKGTLVSVTLATLQGYGLETQQVSRNEWVTKSGRHCRPRVDHWAQAARPAVYYVVSASHAMVIDTRTGEACDNHTVYPLSLSRYKFRRQRVVHAFRITPAQNSPQSMGELRRLLSLP